VAGLDLGLEEDPSAICHHGRDLDGCLASAEGSGEDSDGCGATHTVPGSALDFRGFQDGGGHIRNIDMGCPTQLMVGAIGIRGASMDYPVMDIPMQLILTGILQRHTWDIDEGVN